MTGTPADFAAALLAWYDTARRDLPWRVRAGYPDPYHVLVSEAMLQQTQVAAVVPYFARFLTALPTLHHLADADEQTVLRLWQGLGYYSRARNLRKAAKAVVEHFGGVIPHDVESLLTLPGVGRYTAGAIASLAYDTAAPILDGNVVRVVCRLDAIDTDPRTPAVQKRLWSRAEALLPPARAGDFNSGLMELGATVCTPKTPACLICPVRRFCEAFERQIQHRIPLPKPAKVTPLQQRWTLCLEDDAGRFLIEQRPADGRWAGMWQFTTSPADDVATTLGITASLPVSLGVVRHALTHRRYEFHVARARLTSPKPPAGERRWMTPGEMDVLAFSKPQLAIRRMLT